MSLPVKQSLYRARWDANETVRQAVSALHEAVDENISAMCFEESYDSRRTDDFMIMNDLAQALNKDEELYLAWQPKVCLKSGKTVGLEALIRWNHPERGELFPSEFIPLAGKTNLISDLTNWVIDHTIEQLARWDREYDLIPVFDQRQRTRLRKARFCRSAGGKISGGSVTQFYSGH
ncbi:Bacteriophytochrome cph2 [Pantoea agglomerans]|uniref:Bacteriophytochrome cph2 n=1 Tax=Enterobacter agglomerans TaxID=549 RepID=A0A379LSM7_ENTAG|nr:Bacteriophytochrome cph2 [Pantoea agglomerans]